MPFNPQGLQGIQIDIRDAEGFADMAVDLSGDEPGARKKQDRSIGVFDMDIVEEKEWLSDDEIAEY